MAQETPYPIKDFSGAIQRKTSKFLKRENEVDLAINADFSRIGAVQKVRGYTQKGSNIPTTSTSTSTSTSSSTSSSSSSSSSTTTP